MGIAKENLKRKHPKKPKKDGIKKKKVQFAPDTAEDKSSDTETKPKSDPNAKRERVEAEFEAMMAEEFAHNNNSDIEEDVEPSNVESTTVNALPSDEVAEEKEDKVHFKTKFSMKEFRKKIKTNDFIMDIRQFLSKAGKNSGEVSLYVRKGGKPLELVETLERVDKSQLFHISYVFNAVQLVLIEIMTNATEHTPAAVQACKFLLNSHKQCVEKLLSSHTTKHKTSALKLLTAMVTLEAQLGREILSTFDVISNVKSLEQFTSHSKFETNTKDETVRTCFIHFILAYLIEGKIILIQNLMNRAELINGLMSGLIYDKCETVALVLNTFNKFTLKTLHVSKTKKVQIFNINIVKHLIKLYEWKGPSVFGALFNRKKKNKSEGTIDPEELEVVQTAVQDFLKTLLTSRKYGVSYQCLGQRRLKHNITQKKVLQILNKPWGNEHKSQLVIAILQACPELVSKFIQKAAPYLDPNNKDTNWMQVSAFLIKLIPELGPSIIRSSADKMDVKELISIVKEICLSVDMLIQLRGRLTLKSENVAIRVNVAHLLSLMLCQTKNYLDALQEWNCHKHYDLRKLKFELISHVFVNYPTIENILVALNATLLKQDEDSALTLNHMEYVLDLLLAVSNCFPSFIETTSSVMNYIKILQPIYELNREDASCTRIELKAVKLILVLEPKALSPHTDYFKNVCHSFVNVFIHGTAVERSESKNLLRGILLNSGAFENGSLEIDLWLNSLKLFDEASMEVIIQCFVNAIKESTQGDLNKERLKCLRNAQIAANEDVSNEDTTRISDEDIFSNIDSNSTMNGIVDVPVLSNLFVVMLDMAWKKNGEEKVVQQYVEEVALQLFHYLPSSAVVRTIMVKNDHKYKEYMQNCDSVPSEMRPVFLNALLKHLTTVKSKKSFVELFKTAPKIDSDEILSHFFKYTSLDGRQIFELQLDVFNDDINVMMMIYAVVFHVTRRTVAGILNEDDCTKSLDCLKNLLNILKQKMADSKVDSLKSALNYIYINNFLLLQHFNVWAANDSTASDKCLFQFIWNITGFVKASLLEAPTPNDFQALTLHYRHKIVNQIQQSARESDAPQMNATHLLQILEVLNLDAQDCMKIVIGISDLSHDKYFNKKATEKSVFMDVLVNSLKRMAYLKNVFLDDIIFHRIIKLYKDLIANTEDEVSFEKLEDAIFSYLSVFSHSINGIGEYLFTCIFSCKKLTKPTIKLAVLLLQRDQSLVSVFKKLLKDNVSKKELIYPLLNVLFIKSEESSTFTDDELKMLWSEFKNGIMKTIEKPQKAGVIYKENIKSSVSLIHSCMPLNECNDFAKKSSHKFDGSELYQLDIIKTIFLKSLQQSSSNEQKTVIYKNFLNIWLQLIVLQLNSYKKDVMDIEKFTHCAIIGYHWVTMKERPSGTIDYTSLTSTQYWGSFCKNCLKFGMQLEQDDKGKLKEDRHILLKIMSFLCEHFYPATENNKAVASYYEMAVSHSEFFNVTQIPDQGSLIKCNLMYLLVTLSGKNSAALKKEHIPLLLSAYQAKLSDCDRYILALLQRYEQSGIALEEYRPFIWGESALSFYSLKEQEVKTNVSQEPPMAQVMGLIERELAENTLTNYPVWRKLNALEQLPVVEFNDESSIPTNAANELQMQVERNSKAIDESLLLVASKKAISYAQVYDPAFMVPLLGMVFAPENFVHTVGPVQNGLLAIAFASLSSLDKNMRLSASSALLRYKTHLESSKFADKKLWFHMYDSIQNGLNTLVNESKKHKKAKIPRVPFIAGLFLARTINILIQPLHTMYKVVSMYLLVRKSFDFLAVPEFNVLFHSQDIDHVAHREFILQVVSDGIKCSADFTILISGDLFKAFLGFYRSPMSNRDHNLRILSVINSSAKIPKATKMLIEYVGILPWLGHAIQIAESFHFETLDGIVNIISNLWYSVRANETEYHDLEAIYTRIFHLQMKLLQKISDRFDLSVFSKFLNVLVNVADGHYALVEEVHVDELMELVKRGLEEHIWDVEYIRQNGVSFIESDFTYVKRLQASGVDGSVVFVMSKLREFVVKCKVSNQMDVEV